jgi:Polysaccharide lyase
MRRIGLGALALAALLIIVVLASLFVRAMARTIPTPVESEIELTLVHKGTTYKLYRGDVYKVGSDPGRLIFVDTLYDTDFFAKNYVVVDSVPNKKDSDTGKLYPTRRHFEEGFEDAPGVQDLIGPERGWTSFTLQSPAAPSIPEYNALRQRIMTGQGGFLDNRIETSTDFAHTGKGSLKCTSLPPSSGMTTAKASLTSSLMHFVKGDDVWFSAWFLVPDDRSKPFTVADLESTWIKEHPGMRIMLDPPGYLMLELKWAVKPEYRQPKGREVRFPDGRWVQVRMHLWLSEKNDGIIELWQDGVKIVDSIGQTLPLAGTIYDDLEVGISAHSFGPNPATLYVDDLVISSEPIP